MIFIMFGYTHFFINIFCGFQNHFDKLIIISHYVLIRIPNLVDYLYNIFLLINKTV